VNVRSIFLIFTVSLVSACATPSKAPEQSELPVEATVVWGNQGRGGATERVPGYVHVLRHGEAVYRDEPESPGPEPVKAVFAAPSVPLPSARPVPAVLAVAPSQYDKLLAPQTVAAIMAVTAADVKSEPFKAAVAMDSAGDKLRRAWEKYCNGALGLTDEDWQLVREAGAPDNVPADLAGRCIHPK
jgi:hypothetical protein